MKKQILNLGNALNKAEQKKINGGIRIRVEFGNDACSGEDVCDVDDHCPGSCHCSNGYCR